MAHNHPAPVEPPDWKRAFRTGALWALLAFLVLFFGGLSVRGLARIDSELDLQKAILPFLWWLLIFSGGGGITVGVVVFAWRRANPRRLRWGLAVIGLVVLVFASFVWPTRFKYYTGPKRDALIRVDRISGEEKILYQKREQPPQR